MSGSFNVYCHRKGKIQLIFRAQIEFHILCLTVFEQELSYIIDVRCHIEKWLPQNSARVSL